jgi:hypothetical protein
VYLAAPCRGWPASGPGRLAPACGKAAVATLRELAAGRADLLAKVAGLLRGFCEGERTEPLERRAARLCRVAAAILAWTGEGRRRKAAASLPPSSRGLRRG